MPLLTERGGSDTARLLRLRHRKEVHWLSFPWLLTLLDSLFWKKSPASHDHTQAPCGEACVERKWGLLSKAPACPPSEWATLAATFEPQSNLQMTAVLADIWLQSFESSEPEPPRRATRRFLRHRKGERFCFLLRYQEIWGQFVIQQ